MKGLQEVLIDEQLSTIDNLSSELKASLGALKRLPVELSHSMTDKREHDLGRENTELRARVKELEFQFLDI